MSMETTVAQLAHARLVAAGDREVPVPATLRYTSDDPLAVYLDFPAEAALHGEEVTWTFARSLLDEGLGAPAGQGDVRIRPCGRTGTVLELHSPHGMALLLFPAPVLRCFLRRTYEVVADGEEDVTGVVKRGLSALFGGV